MAPPFDLAIIGGGFSGTMAAVNLVRFGDRPLLVRLINRAYPLGRGIAYSTRRCAGFRPSRTSGSARPMITLIA